MLVYVVLLHLHKLLPLFDLLDGGLPLLWQQRVDFWLPDPNGKKLQDLACLERKEQTGKLN